MFDRHLILNIFLYEQILSIQLSGWKSSRFCSNLTIFLFAHFPNFFIYIKVFNALLDAHKEIWTLWLHRSAIMNHDQLKFIYVSLFSVLSCNTGIFWKVTNFPQSQTKWNENKIEWHFFNLIRNCEMKFFSYFVKDFPHISNNYLLYKEDE